MPAADTSGSRILGTSLTGKRLRWITYLTIHRAYLLKESFRDFWQSATKDVAAKFLGQWCSWADESEIKPIQDVASLLKSHEENILTYFKIPISK